MAQEPSNGRDNRLVSCFGSPVSVSVVIIYRQCSGFLPMKNGRAKMKGAIWQCCALHELSPGYPSMCHFLTLLFQ